MTARKRLTDMVREEVQKPAESEPETSTASEATGTAENAASEKTIDKTVADLKQSLDEARKRETALQKQHAGLESELKQVEAKSSQAIAQLKEAQELVAQLKAELEQARKDNLQLAAANIKLTEDLNALKPAAPAAPIVPTPQRSMQKRSVNPGARYQRPIGSNANLSKIDERNIGWVD